MHATIQWSYDLLGSTERGAFARLAVFAGSFDVEAAEDVCGAELETLESLMDKSLLRRTAEGRLFMLETIREFALEQLAAMPEEGDTRRRHIEHALARAKQPPSPEIPDWLRRVDRDYSELRGALTWLREQHEEVLLLQLASRLGRFWDSRALLQEGRMWLEAAVATAPAGPSSDTVEAFTRLGHIAWRQGDVEAARPALDSAEAGARELGDVRTIGWLHTNRGAIGITTGDLVVARSEYEYALAIFREIGATQEVAIATHDLGLIATEEADYPRARQLLQESAHIARSIGSSGAEANALGSLGFVAFEQGNLDEAWEMTLEAIRLNRTENFTNLSVAGDLLMAAQIIGARGDHETACRLVGVFDGYVELTGAALDPIPARQRTALPEVAEENIGREAVDRALEAGRSLSLTEALDFVLSID